VAVSQRARRIRVIAAWVLLVGTAVGWPLSMLTVAKSEPPFVLSLSWLAILIEAVTLLTSSQVHKEQGEKGPD
jgi:ribose/xylose/arabinose/galactoside ABC-type transport system permease subunit